MATSLCNRCGSSPARVAVVAPLAHRYIPYCCAPCAVETAKEFAARGVRVRIDALMPRAINANVASDGSFWASDVDCAAHQRVLDARAADFARRVGRIVAALELRRAAA
jgi:hypothetical protein